MNEALPDGFQMTELGPLPEDWKVVRLGEVAQFQTGQREKGGARTDQGIISVGGEHITEDGQINFMSSPKYVSREFFQNMATGKVNPGDILVVKDGARTGKSAFVRQVPPTGMAANEHVFIIRVHNQNAVAPEYVAFWFRSKMAWDQIRSAYHGLIGGINRREVTKFLLGLPPLPEQRAIAHVLRTVQRAKEATEGVIAALRELKKSLMQHLFTYGPVPVTERERVPLQETEIGPLPAHWRVVRLGEVFEIFAGGDISRLNWSPIRKGEFIYPIFSNSLENEGLYGYADTYQFPENSITVTGRGNLGHAVPRNEKFCAIIRLLVLVPKTEIETKFVAEFINGFIKVNLEGSSIPQLTRPKIATYRIPLPPLDEQREIARILQAVDAKIAAEQARRAALEELFKSLLHELMSGRIRVPNIVGGQRSRDSAPDADPLPESED
jgi:type I restriction enzyme S subunit